MKFIRPKKGSPEHDEVELLRGGDYKGEPSDYQAALKKWNISKGWQDTKIWQAPYKQKKYKKASPEYGEVLEMMKTSRTTGMAEAEALYEKLLENTKFNKAKLRFERGKVMKRIREKTGDERKFAQTLQEFVEEVRQENIAKFGEDPLGEAVPKAEAEAATQEAEAAAAAEPEAVPAAKKIYISPTLNDFKISLSKEPIKISDKTFAASRFDRYIRLMYKYEAYVKSQPVGERQELYRMVKEKQKELLDNKDITESGRLQGLTKFIGTIVPFNFKYEEQSPLPVPTTKPLILKPVDDMRTKDVLIEANVLAGNEAQAKRVEVPGGSRSTPKDFGTSIADGRARLKEYRQAIYGKTEGIVMKNPKYNLRPGSLM